MAPSCYKKPPELLVVLPTYNEEEALPQVIPEWIEALSDGVNDFVLLAIDDGSSDSSRQTLDSLQRSRPDQMEVVSRPNRGHGQTCLEGYRIAIERGIPFILQIDSDGQSNPQHFKEFWVLRNDFDVIYGQRSRSDGIQRVVASWVLRTLLLIWENVDCVDANVPYRLMNTRTCAKEILAVPSFVSLANIALAVLLRRNVEVRHGSVPITFPPRLGGEPSVPTAQFASKAIKLLKQLKAIRS